MNRTSRLCYLFIFLAEACRVAESASPPASNTGLVNLSTRGEIREGPQVMISGFVIHAPSNILIRGVGPTLVDFGVVTALPDPRLTLFEQGSTLVARNDGWPFAITGPGIPVYPTEEAPIALLTGIMQSIGAFELRDTADAALYLRLAPGIYTAHLSSVSGSQGIGLNEVYLVPDSVDPFPPGLRIRTGNASGYNPVRGGLAPNGAVDETSAMRFDLSFNRPVEWIDGNGKALQRTALALTWHPTGTGDIRLGRAGIRDSRHWSASPQYEKTGPDTAVVRNLVTCDATGHSFIEEAVLTFTRLSGGHFTYRWGTLSESGETIERDLGAATGTFAWTGTNSGPVSWQGPLFYRVFPATYRDGRPSTSWALRTNDYGPVLVHGKGPFGSDVNGAREVIVTATDEGYVMHYDGCGRDGWLACRALSPDLVHWKTEGPILPAGPPGTIDAGCVCSPWTVFDGTSWHMFYLATPDKSPPPGSVPQSPYQTLKASAPSILGPWTKQPEYAPFEYSPGPVIRNGSTFHMFFTTTQPPSPTNPLMRTLGLGSTDDPELPWSITVPFLLPPGEQIENASLYREPANGLWFLFTNHVGIDNTGFESTDAVWVYWSEDFTRFDTRHKARVIDAASSNWAKGPIGMPSVVPVGNRLALFYDGSPSPTRSHLERDIGLAFIDLPLQPPMMDGNP